AGDQARFWEMHDALFADQRRLDRAALAERAQNLELEMADFDSCLDGGAKTRVVERDMELGLEAGVGGTPSIYINGRPVALSSANSLTSVIDDELSRLGE
ncbi:MAG: thioredoxin domain-containing protein, partial [Acidobacteriota bacterium]